MSPPFPRAHALVALFLLAAVPRVVCAAPLPDLSGSDLHLEKAIPGTSCFDPDQPWYVCVTIENAPQAGAPLVGDFNLQLDVMKGPKFGSGVFAKSWKVVEGGMGKNTFIGVCIQLPKNVDVNSLGTQRAFRVMIDPNKPDKVDESNEENNVVGWEFGVKPPIMEMGGSMAPQPDKDLQIFDTAAIPGNTQSLLVKIKNKGPVKSKKMKLFLTQKLPPPPGSPTGQTNVGTSAPIPPLAPGAIGKVKITGLHPFVEPLPQQSGGTPPAKVTLAQSLAAQNKLVVTRPRTGLFNLGRRQSTLVATAPPPPDYKILIPFTLRILGTDQIIHFGNDVVEPGGGPIKIPGKK